jgi:glutamyl-tRNA synthetase
LLGPEEDERAALARAALALEHDKLKTLAEAPQLVEFFFNEEIEYDDRATKNLLKLPGGADALRDLAELCAALPDFTAAAFEEAVRKFAEEKGIGAGKVIHAIRAALSGRAAGPSLFEMAALMGRENAVKRLMEATSVYER